MIAIQVQDWSAVLDAFSSFFNGHGTISAHAEAVGFTASSPRTGVTIHRTGQVSAYMPLHTIELQASRLVFDEAQGELRVEGAAAQYLYRRPW